MNDVGTPSKSSSYRFYNRSRHAPSRQQFAIGVCVLIVVGALVLFAATLVGCLLSGRAELIHFALLGTGAGLIALSYVNRR